MTYSPVMTRPQAIVLRSAFGGAWYGRTIALAAFVSAFVFDVLPLPRVDSWLLRYAFQHGGTGGAD